MKTVYRYAHLHGFASSSLSRKGVYLAEAFAVRGIDLALPDMNRPSFARITYTDALTAMDELDQDTDGSMRWRISGSSMGGYMAARWAELHPDRVDRLALLCPGFRLGSRWPHLIGREAYARWQKDGAIPLPDATGRMVPVHWGLIEDCANHPPYPEVPCPTLILHGKHDETVPVESSQDYAAQRPDRVRLIVLDGDHSLWDQIERISQEILTFFDLA